MKNTTVSFVRSGAVLPFLLTLVLLVLNLVTGLDSGLRWGLLPTAFTLLALVIYSSLMGPSKIGNAIISLGVLVGIVVYALCWKVADSNRLITYELGLYTFGIVTIAAWKRAGSDLPPRPLKGGLSGARRIHGSAIGASLIFGAIQPAGLAPLVAWVGAALAICQILLIFLPDPPNAISGSAFALSLCYIATATVGHDANLPFLIAFAIATTSFAYSKVFPHLHRRRRGSGATH